MDSRLITLLNQLTPQERAEVETFAAFLMARRSKEYWLLLPDSLPSAEPKHSILELRGLGKEVWKDIDAQEYVNQERTAWHG